MSHRHPCTCVYVFLPTTWILALQISQTIYLSFVWWPWHILSVGADVTQTHKWHCLTIILFWRGLALGKKRKHLPEIHISHHTQKHFLTFSGTPPWGFNRFSSHRVLYSLPGGGGVLKVFITNLPSTCWLLRISGQFCDGSFSKSVINTKTAHTRLSIQNNLFLSSAQIVSRIFIIELHQFPSIKMDLSLAKAKSPIFMTKPSDS